MFLELFFNAKLHLEYNSSLPEWNPGPRQATDPAPLTLLSHQLLLKEHMTQGSIWALPKYRAQILTGIPSQS